MLTPSLCNLLSLSIHLSIYPSAHVCAELIQPLKGNGNTRSDPAVTEVTDILSVNIYNSLTTR